MTSQWTIGAAQARNGSESLRGGLFANAVRRIRRAAVPWLWALVFPTVLLPIWFAGSIWGWLPEQILPKPADVLITLLEMLRSGELKAHTGISLLRVVSGFGIGTAAGLLLGAIPSIFTGLRYGLTHAWIALVSVELVASSGGLGYLLVWGRQMFWLDTVLVAMIVIGLIGFITDKLLAMIEQHLQRWRIDGA